MKAIWSREMQLDYAAYYSGSSIFIATILSSISIGDIVVHLIKDAPGWSDESSKISVGTCCNIQDDTFDVMFDESGIVQFIRDKSSRNFLYTLEDYHRIEK